MNETGVYVLDIGSVPKVAYRIGYSSSNGYSADISNNGAYNYSSTGEQIPFTPALTDGFLRAPLIERALHYYPPGYEFLPTTVQYTQKVEGVLLHAVLTQKIYALSPDNATVSIRSCTFAYDQHSSCTPIQKPIAVGQHAGPIAVNDKTAIVYIGHPECLRYKGFYR